MKAMPTQSSLMSMRVEEKIHKVFVIGVVLIGARFFQNRIENRNFVFEIAIFSIKFASQGPQGSSRRKQGTRTQRTRSLPCVAPDWSDPRESQRIMSPSSPSSPNLNPFRHDPTSRPARASDEDLNPFLRDPTSRPARASG